MKKIKTAVILAAGTGTRFGLYTENIPKGFVEINGKAMVIRSIEMLISCGIERIIIGTGYKEEYYEALKTNYPQIECCYSPMYAETNSMFTLYNCREVIGQDDFLLLESDLIYEQKAITSLLTSDDDNVMLIAPVTKIQDQYYVEMNEYAILTNCSTDESTLSPSGELVGINKISNTFYQKMCNEYEAILHEKPKLGYEFQLLFMSKYIQPMRVLKVEELLWYEIDDEIDLKYAEDKIINLIKAN